MAVLAHELGHVYAHHAARLTVSEIRSRMTASALLSLVKVENRLYRQLIDIGVDVGIDLLLKGYSRQYETEADRYATHIAFNAGYNPTFMTSLFVRLYRLDPSTHFRLTATHPPTSERIERTRPTSRNSPSIGRCRWTAGSSRRSSGGWADEIAHGASLPDCVARSRWS